MSFNAAPTESFDVIVVGGGHAGCEAAITAARLGLNTALFSLNRAEVIAASQPAWPPPTTITSKDSVGAAEMLMASLSAAAVVQFNSSG